MKQIIFSFFFLTFISFVYGLSSSATGTGSGSISTTMSNSVSTSFSSTVSTSFSNTITMSVTSSMSGSMSPSTSFSYTQTITQTVSGTSSLSISRSYTITRSMSMLHYFAPTNVVNTCSNEKSLICLKWDETVVTITYDSFNVIAQILDSKTYYLFSDIKGAQYVINGLQPGTPYIVSVQGQIGSIKSPWSPSYLFQTYVDSRKGVNSVDCSTTTTSKTVDCTWRNGVNPFSKIIVKLYCPIDSTTYTFKTRVTDSLTAITLPGVPSKTDCRVVFKIHYDAKYKFKTQVVTAYSVWLSS